MTANAVFESVGLGDLETVAISILDRQPQRILLLKGEMGSGKTTLTEALCKALEVSDTVSSPTYSIVNEYHTKNDEVVYHFDCYRMESETEAYDIGIEEYLYSGDWCLIEWPEKIRNLLPEQYSTLHLERLPSGERCITLSTTTHE
jgi:tRNA threonylcarbamoyladenosine biosynthesis protein TsaE